MAGPVAKFLVQDWAKYPTLAYDCQTGPPAYAAWRVGTTRLVIYIPQSET